MKSYQNTTLYEAFINVLLSFSFFKNVQNHRKSDDTFKNKVIFLKQKRVFNSDPLQQIGAELAGYRPVFQGFHLSVFNYIGIKTLKCKP